MDSILNIFNFRRETHLQRLVPRDCHGLMRAPLQVNTQLRQPTPLHHVEPAPLSPPLPAPPGSYPTPSPPLLTILPLLTQPPLSPVVSWPDIYHFSHSSSSPLPQYTPLPSSPPPAYYSPTSEQPHLPVTLHPSVSTAPSTTPPPGRCTPSTLASLRAALIQLDTAIYLHHLCSTGRDDMAPTSQRAHSAGAGAGAGVTTTATTDRQQQQLHRIGQTIRSAGSDGTTRSDEDNDGSSAELADLLPFLLDAVWTHVHALAGEDFA